MPNRIIKESIRTSKSVNSLKDFEFRLWVYLITYVDDYGRGSADTEILKGFVLPRRKGTTEANIAEALHNLACAGLVNLYDVDGEPFLCFPNWDRHQTIRAKVSKFPAPVDSLQADESICKHMQADVPVIVIQSESNKEILPKGNTKKVGKPPFCPPTLAEVKAYCEERGNNVDAEHFVDYYSANGWMVGKNKMRDWKAAVRTWENNGFDKKPKEDPKPQSFDVDEFFENALKKTYGEKQ